MFVWIKGILLARDENVRLKEEIAGLKSENVEMRSRNEALQKALFREINSNRRREDALKEGLRAPRRGEIETIEAAPKVETFNELKPSDIDPDFEQRVEMRARELQENSLRKGITLNPYEVDLLKARIRENPEELLYN